MTRACSFHHPVALYLALLGLVLLPFLGCATAELPPDTATTIINPDSDDSSTAQMVTISGQTMTIEGAVLSDAWVMILDDATQQVQADTFSDQNGNFAITLNGANDGYTLLAAHQDDTTTLIAWESFSITEEIRISVST